MKKILSRFNYMQTRVQGNLGETSDQPRWHHCRRSGHVRHSRPQERTTHTGSGADDQ